MWGKINITAILLFMKIYFNFSYSQNDTIYFDNYKHFTNSIFEEIKIKYPEVDIFKYKSLIPPGNNYFNWYKGSLEDSAITGLRYLAYLYFLNISKFSDDFSYNVLMDRITNYRDTNTALLSLSLFEYYDIKDSLVFFNQPFSTENHKLKLNFPSNFFPFKKNYSFVTSGLTDLVFTKEIKFKLDKNLIFSNISKDSILSLLENLWVDFDDHNGFRKLESNNVISVSYSNNGIKYIRFKLFIRHQDTLYAKYKLVVNDADLSLKTLSSVEPPDDGPFSISTVDPVSGNNISGKYAIWYGNQCFTNKKLRKPYIITVGFNPGNGKQLLSNNLPPILNFVLNNITISFPGGGWNGDWRGTYYETYNGVYNKRFSPNEVSQYGETSNGCRLLDRIREEGYDVVILQFDNGIDYIQNNALLLEKLINKINQDKFQNGYYFENIVSGYSAGAMASRMALARMESKFKSGTGNHHHTKMWISFDGEHQGGYVPLGLQYLIDYQSYINNVMPPFYFQQAAADLINQFATALANSYNNSPTARQLTTYLAYMNGGQHPDRVQLLNEYNNIPLNNRRGFPEYTRNIGISQGSGIGINNVHSYDYIFDAELFAGFKNETAVSFPSDCGGSYTWYLPHADKRTTAKWWGSTNSSPILFNGYTIISGMTTIIPRICANIPFVGCQCKYEVTIGGVNVLGNVTKYRPGNNNADDVPASTQATQVELYNSSAYPFYNNWLAGFGNNNTFANIDAKLHGFVPTVSALDLRDIATGLPINHFTNISSLNVHYINPTDIQSNFRYGFPHLKYFNHYLLTPFDAIYSVGTDNGFYINNTPKPSNQFHVEDPQVFIGDFLSRIEIAPTHLFLSNRTIGSTMSGYIAEFEARNKVTIGRNDISGNQSIYIKNINDNKPHYLTEEGDFYVTNNSKVIIHAGEEIEFLPGTSIDMGSELIADVNVSFCPDLLFRQNNTASYSNSNINNENTISNNKEVINKSNTYSYFDFYVFPNPNNTQKLFIKKLSNKMENNKVTISIKDISGKCLWVEQKNIDDEIILNLPLLSNGIYLLSINQETHKLIIEQ
jgi:hypothetical protein